MRLFFLLTPVNADPASGLDGGVEGVCVCLDGSSLNMEYRAAGHKCLFTPHILYNKKRKHWEGRERLPGDMRAPVPLLRTALRTVTHDLEPSGKHSRLREDVLALWKILLLQYK